jgi:hypothetical protein
MVLAPKIISINLPMTRKENHYRRIIVSLFYGFNFIIGNKISEFSVLLAIVFVLQTTSIVEHY